jgi:hypothetical protein
MALILVDKETLYILKTKLDPIYLYNLYLIGEIITSTPLSNKGTGYRQSIYLPFQNINYESPINVGDTH